MRLLCSAASYLALQGPALPGFPPSYGPHTIYHSQYVWLTAYGRGGGRSLQRWGRKRLVPWNLPFYPRILTLGQAKYCEANLPREVLMARAVRMSQGGHQSSCDGGHIVPVESLDSLSHTDNFNAVPKGPWDGTTQFEPSCLRLGDNTRFLRHFEVLMRF